MVYPINRYSYKQLFKMFEKDTVINKIEICNDLEEFSKQIENLGSTYGGRIDEVKWSQDKNVSDEQYSEINAGMRKYQEEFDKKSEA